MSHCPVSHQICVDDFCRGSFQCVESGESMLERCGHCKELMHPFSLEGCECDPDGDEQAESDGFEDGA